MRVTGRERDPETKISWTLIEALLALPHTARRVRCLGALVEPHCLDLKHSKRRTLHGATAPEQFLQGVGRTRYMSMSSMFYALSTRGNRMGMRSGIVRATLLMLV